MTNNICGAIDCARPVVAKGYCSIHWRRQHEQREINARVRIPAGGLQCSVVSCERAVLARGFCNMHYQRHRLGKDMFVAPRVPYNGKLCEIEGCERVCIAGNLCMLHHGRKRNGTVLTKPLRRVLKVGDTLKEGSGYTLIRVDEGTPGANNFHCILEHRLVMQTKIGRSLLEHEQVHHLNGDRSDNSVENLELWSTRQPSGQRITDKISFSTDVLLTYLDQIKMDEIDRATMRGILKTIQQDLSIL